MPTNQVRNTLSNTSNTASQLIHQGAKRRSETVEALLEGQDVSSDSDIEFETNTEDLPVASTDVNYLISLTRSYSVFSHLVLPLR